MFKGVILSDTSVLQNVNVPFTVVRNTNGNTRYDSQQNAVAITSGGYYDIMATIVATSTSGGTISAQLYADGVPVTGAVSTQTVTATGTATFTLIDNENVQYISNNNFADISVRFDQPVTVNDAVLLVEKRK